MKSQKHRLPKDRSDADRIVRRWDWFGERHRAAFHLSYIALRCYGRHPELLTRSTVFGCSIQLPLLYPGQPEPCVRTHPWCAQRQARRDPHPGTVTNGNSR